MEKVAGLALAAEQELASIGDWNLGCPSKEVWI